MYCLKSVEDSLSELESSEEGLQDSAIAALREKFGYNELPLKKKSLITLFFSQFNDVLVYILIGALLLSGIAPFFEGEHVSWKSFLDTYVILAILILNAVLGFVQEFKAEEAIEMLEKLTSPEARVRRNGEEAIIPSRELLPGDIVVLEEGDKISADGRIISTSHFRTNESSLTGESALVTKQLDTLPEECPLAERTNMVFSGTLVAVGSAEYVVTATGVYTEIGKIAKLVSETIIPETPLQVRMKSLGKFLGLVVLGLCLVVMIAGYFHEHTLIESLLIAVSLAVSAVPEGLPAVVTVCFAMGVKRMVKQNALVRKLDSLETLGSVTVICADKTGTITQNKMSVVEAWAPEVDGKEAPEHDYDFLALIGASCNRAQLPNFGDPTEIGLLEYAHTRGVERHHFDEEEVPFSSEEKYMQTKHGSVSYLKGAPEKIITLCTTVDKELVEQKNLEMAKKGIRVLAGAVQENGETRFVGLIGMEDPPRKSVKGAVKEAADAGIRTVMITGDNIETAKAIADQIGIVGDAMHGKDLDALTVDELNSRVQNVSVYARVSPVHKLKILEALQRDGEIVSMSGDGVNDAPALKGAHVGIAMGLVGTQVAREASSIVLADDHFSTIVNAVREGRRIYDNIRKFVLFLLRSNFDEILFIITTLLLDMPLPYLPLHILWINLMTDSLPALALGMEKAEPDIMKRKPRPMGEHILSGEWGRLIFAALWGFLLSFVLYSYLLSKEIPLPETRATILTMAIFMELFMVFSLRSKQPLWKIGIFSNRWLVGAVVVPIVMHVLLLNTAAVKLFHLAPLSISDWMFAIAFAFSGLVVFEVWKVVSPKKSIV